jgi:sulfotransferase family protein
VAREEYAREWTQRLRGRLHTRRYLDLNRDYKNSIFLAGSARSGTTWVSDIINYKNEYRFVFEPFHPSKVRICKGFKPKQYLRPEDRREEFLLPARTILSGGLRSTWTDHSNERFLSWRRLIKDIRANLMLGWIHANFPGMPIILLLRHPCAVASSKTRLRRIRHPTLRRRWMPRLNDYLSQSDLVEDFLEPFVEEMRSARDDFERDIFSWCVENYVPLKQFGPGEMHLTYYERLCEDPNDELGRLGTFLGRSFDNSVLERVNRPSKLSRPKSAILSGESLVADWRKVVTDAQLERAVEILGLFGLDEIYSEEPMPNTGGARTLMGAGSAKAAPEPERKSS